jgi:hypothetical protein
MTCKYSVSRIVLAAVVFNALTAFRALAGAAAIGTIAGSLNATVGGEAIQPNTVVFSGDTVQVRDGAAVVAMNSGNRVVFGQRTAASFLRGSSEVTVLLQEGNLSMYHPTSGGSLRILLGPLSVTPMKGFTTLGDVAMLNGVAVVTAKEGAMRLERNGQGVEVRAGQTVTVSTHVARAPQGAPSAGAGAPPTHGVSSSVMQWIGVGAGAVGATIGLVALSHGNSANDTASKALAASSSAVSTANSALTAAQGALSDAAAAATAAQAASSVASAAALTAQAAVVAANTVGCDLNKFANSEGKPSPYTPFPGLPCH